MVDTFNGDVKFYVMDAGDPMFGVYRKAFPGVFKNLDELPSDLKAHLRYPKDIFTGSGQSVQDLPYEGPAGLL